MGRDLLMGKKRLVQTWQWVSRALLITVCNPSWVDVRDYLMCCCEGGTQARRKRWLVFIVLLTADISPNFVCEIPNHLSSVCLCSGTSDYTNTPVCNGVEFCPKPAFTGQCILWLSRKNCVFCTWSWGGWIAAWIERKGWNWHLHSCTCAI